MYFVASMSSIICVKEVYLRHNTLIPSCVVFLLRLDPDTASDSEARNWGTKAVSQLITKRVFRRRNNNADAQIPLG